MDPWVSTVLDGLMAVFDAWPGFESFALNARLNAAVSIARMGISFAEAVAERAQKAGMFERLCDVLTRQDDVSC